MKNIPYILCKVNSKNLFCQLLFRTIFGNTFHENPELTLKKILYEEEYKKIYCAEAYNLLSNNSQFFVAKVIEASFCTISTDNNRHDNENEQYLPYLSNSRIDYETLSYMIPTNIAKALKNNEILIEDRVSKGKSNIVEDNVDLYNQFNYENYFQVIERVFNNS